MDKLDRKCGDFFAGRLFYSPGIWKIFFPLLLLVITVVTGSIGYHESYKLDRWRGAWESVGHLMGETSFKDADEYIKTEISTEVFAQADAWLKVSRVSGLLLAFSAFFLLVHSQYGEHFNRWRIGAWRIRNKKYAVVCGLGWKGCELARKLVEEGMGVVGIDPNKDDSSIIELRRMGVAVFEGDATVDAVLAKAGVRNAAEIYVMTSSDEVNCRIAMQLDRVLPKASLKRCRLMDGEGKLISVAPNSCEACAGENTIMCYVAVERYRPRMYLENALRKSIVRMHCFSPLERAVRDLFRTEGIAPVASDEPGSPEHVHTVVFGATPAAKAVLLQSLRMLHLKPGQQRKITVICENEEEEARSFYREYPCLRPAAELSSEMRKATEGIFPEVKFERLPTANADFLTDGFYLYEHMKPDWRINVYFCIDDGIRSISLMELLMPRIKFLKPGASDRLGKRNDLMIAAYFNYPERVGDLDETPECFEFGSYGVTCNPSFIRSAKVERLAQGVGLFYHFKYNNKENAAAWKAAPQREKDCYEDRIWLDDKEWGRESNRQTADHMAVKMALMGCGMDDEGLKRFGEILDRDETAMEILAELEHRRWCAERLLGGWLPPSSKDTECSNGTLKGFRRNKCLFPYEKLPQGEKQKDHAMILKIPKLLGALMGEEKE